MFPVQDIVFLEQRTKRNVSARGRFPIPTDTDKVIEFHTRSGPTEWALRECPGIQGIRRRRLISRIALFGESEVNKMEIHPEWKGRARLRVVSRAICSPDPRRQSGIQRDPRVFRAPYCFQSTMSLGTENLVELTSGRNGGVVAVVVVGWTGLSNTSYAFLIQTEKFRRGFEELALERLHGFSRATTMFLLKWLSNVRRGLSSSRENFWVPRAHRA